MTTRSLNPLALIGALGVSIIGYYISASLLTANINGDQYFYTEYYHVIAGKTLAEAFALQPYYVGGYEPVYAILMWAGSTVGFEKIYYISAYNAAFMAILFLVLFKFRTGFIFGILIYCNFYMFVLLTGAERLKFSYIAFALMFLLNGKLRWVFFSLPFFCHFQSVVNYISGLIWFLFEAPQIKAISKKDASHIFIYYVLPALSAAIFLAGVFAYYFELIASKISAYASENFQLSELLNLGVLVFAGMFIFRNKIRFLSAMLPVIIAASIVGNTRINMVGVAMFLYFTMQDNKTRNPIVYAILAYFAYKSIAYIDNIYTYGDGFITGIEINREL